MLHQNVCIISVGFLRYIASTSVINERKHLSGQHFGLQHVWKERSIFESSISFGIIGSEFVDDNFSSTTPSVVPTADPSPIPSPLPGMSISENPTGKVTTISEIPSSFRSSYPVSSSSNYPDLEDGVYLSTTPSVTPTAYPSPIPSTLPSMSITDHPTGKVAAVSEVPSDIQSRPSSELPSLIQTSTRSDNYPTLEPTVIYEHPSHKPTNIPNFYPTPSQNPSFHNLFNSITYPSVQPTKDSMHLSDFPTYLPSNQSVKPGTYSSKPTSAQLKITSKNPSSSPTKIPSLSPISSLSVPSNYPTTFGTSYVEPTVTPTKYLHQQRDQLCLRLESIGYMNSSAIKFFEDSTTDFLQDHLHSKGLSSYTNFSTSVHTQILAFDSSESRLEECPGIFRQRQDAVRYVKRKMQETYSSDNIVVFFTEYYSFDDNIPRNMSFRKEFIEAFRTDLHSFLVRLSRLDIQFSHLPTLFASFQGERSDQTSSTWAASNEILTILVQVLINLFVLVALWIVVKWRYKRKNNDTQSERDAFDEVRSTDFSIPKFSICSVEVSQRSNDQEEINIVRPRPVQHTLRSTREYQERVVQRCHDDVATNTSACNQIGDTAIPRVSGSQYSSTRSQGRLAKSVVLDYSTFVNHNINIPTYRAKDVDRTSVHGSVPNMFNPQQENFYLDQRGRHVHEDGDEKKEEIICRESSFGSFRDSFTRFAWPDKPT